MRSAPALALAGLLVACNALTGASDLAVGDEAGDVGNPSRVDASVDQSAPPPPEPPVDAASDAVDGTAADAKQDATRDGGPFVFVTSATMTGGFGGAAEADTICTNVAGKAGLGRTFVAWVSTSNSDAISRITTTGPWHLLDGTLAVTSSVQLTGTTIAHAINMTELGTALTGDTHVWTATKNGTYTGAITAGGCLNWTNGTSAEPGDVGSAVSAGVSWTASTTVPCSYSLHLYCFEN